MKIKVKSLEECLKIDANLDGIMVDTFRRLYSDKELEITLHNSSNTHFVIKNGIMINRLFCTITPDTRKEAALDALRLVENRFDGVLVEEFKIIRAFIEGGE